MKRTHATPAATRALAGLVVTLVLAASLRAADAGPAGAHPFFPDGGALAWYVDLQEAQLAARAQGKVLFIEYGRKECTNCRTLVSRILPTAGLRERFVANAIGLAADCDEPDPKLEALFKIGLGPDAKALPFVAFASPDLEWIGGWAGGIDVPGCASRLDAAEAWRARASAARAAAKRAAPPRPTTPVAPRVNGAVPATVRPLGVGPTAPRTPTTEELTRARDALAKAKTASAAARHGEVLRLDASAGRSPVRVEPEIWAQLRRTAMQWSEERLSTAAARARDKKRDEASRLLVEVSIECAGCPPGVDAERGKTALFRLQILEAVPAERRAHARQEAAKEFSGTRWATLFQG
jgi:hypothetical protein